MNYTGTDKAELLNGGIGADSILGLGGNDTLNGNAGNDTIDGGAGDDTLTGGTGNDAMTGGTGNDAMTGGIGNDTYYVDALTDLVTELAGEGLDKIYYNIATATSITLANNVENGELQGTASQALNGNTLDNALTGNTAANTLNGDAGNDTLAGGAGTDTLIGGDGGDTYVLLSANKDSLDVITETGASGIDVIQADFTYSIANRATIEGITLTGGAAISATGNAGANILVGNAAANALTGGAGDDTLIGGGGKDTLIGGDGGDTYVLKAQTMDSLDVISETGTTGIDLIQADFTYSIANMSVFEGIILDGTAAINATGNTGANLLVGNSAANALLGGIGNDSLYGGQGKDTLDGGADSDRLDGGLDADSMSGGAGDDIYVVDNVGDVVNELASAGTDTVITLITLTLQNENIERLWLGGEGSSAVINGTGNTRDNLIWGSLGNNSIDGAAGNDSLFGLAGDDTLLGGAGNDGLDGGEGNDVLDGGAGLNILLGGAGDDILIGRGSDRLDGGDGNDVLRTAFVGDVLIGGRGDDIYMINVANTNMQELGELGGDDQVISTVSFTLGNNIERLTLVGVDRIDGVGNSLGNTLTGNDQANTLRGEGGDDLLNGGLGADTLLGGEGDDALFGDDGIDSMSGGAGNDTYQVDSITETVTELAGDGIDTVYSTANGTVLSDNVEVLWLQGPSALDGSGNSTANLIYGNEWGNQLFGMADDDELLGLDGNDTLDGGAGNDLLEGGAGEDIYNMVGAFGQDQILDQDDSGNVFDALNFDAVRYDQLWFAAVGNDLRVSVIGTANQVTITDWYSGTDNHIEEFYASNASMSLNHLGVDQLVSAMASLSASVPTTTTLSADALAKLQPTLSLVWDPA
jgi:Ca2+-binding RTX toxin-like protein